MEIGCPHSTVHRKAPTKALIEPGNSGFTCSIDGLRVLATGARLLSLILWMLGTVRQWSRKGSHTYLPRNMGATVIDHGLSCHTRRRVDWIVDTVCSPYQNKTVSTFSFDQKTIAAFDLNFCPSKSTNVGNMSKVDMFMTRFMGMACN